MHIHTVASLSLWPPPNTWECTSWRTFPPVTSHHWWRRPRPTCISSANWATPFLPFPHVLPSGSRFWKVFCSTALPTTQPPPLQPPEKNHDKADILKDQAFVAVFFSYLFICPPPSLMEHHLLCLRSSMTEQDAQVCQTLAQIHHLLPCNVSNWPLLHEQNFPSRYYQTLLLECAKKCEMLLNMTWWHKKQSLSVWILTRAFHVGGTLW